ncbi:MAG: hypothetical protein NTAFB09_10230 [Nitrosospira sp.]
MEFNDGQLDKPESTMWIKFRSVGWKGFAEAQLARGTPGFVMGANPHLLSLDNSPHMLLILKIIPVRTAPTLAAKVIQLIPGRPQVQLGEY